MNERTSLNAPMRASLAVKRLSPIVALHCSGADGAQWSSLGSVLESKATLIAPDFLGTRARGHVDTSKAFRLKDEAAHVIALIQEAAEPVHLVGHSYGGAVALHIACAVPHLVRSLCVYEPTLFSLLSAGTAADRALYGDICRLAASLQAGIEEDHCAFSAEVFTDFWGGYGAWLALSRMRQDALIQWIPKVVKDFEALLHEENVGRIATVTQPITVLVGAQTHPHTTAVSHCLARLNPRVARRVVAGAGHMGPFTMRDRVNSEILDRVFAVEGE